MVVVLEVHQRLSAWAQSFPVLFPPRISHLLHIRQNRFQRFAQLKFVAVWGLIRLGQYQIEHVRFQSSFLSIKSGCVLLSPIYVFSQQRSQELFSQQGLVGKRLEPFGYLHLVNTVCQPLFPELICADCHHM